MMTGRNSKDEGVNFKRTRRIISHPLQRKLLMFIFAASLIPSGIITVCLYYLIFNLMAWQVGLPDVISSNLIPMAQRVSLIILVLFPVALLIIWNVAIILSHRITGPVYRLETDLKKYIQGEKKGPIRLREKDELQDLVSLINQLIDKDNEDD